MSKPRKSAGKGKRKGKPQRKSGPHAKQTQKAKSGRGTSRRGRGKSPSSSSSSSSNSSSGDDEPAPAPAPAPGDDSSDAESSSDELDPRLRREYHPEGMLAARALLREKRRRKRLSDKRRRKADQHPLPVVPADPFPPQFGGFPEDWPDDGTFPAWFADKAKAMGHDLEDARNVAALQKMVEACRRVDMRPLMQGRLIAPTRAIKNFVLLAEQEDGERAAELKAAAKSLRDLRGECQRNARPAKAPKGCCRMCGLIGAFALERCHDVTCRSIKIQDTLVELDEDDELKMTDLRDPLKPVNQDLVNDHLEWSERHRLWVCTHCNTKLIPLLDMLDDESVADYFWRDYELAFFYT